MSPPTAVQWVLRLPDFGVIVCRKCQYAVRPTSIVKHLRRTNHKIAAWCTREIQETVSTWDGCVADPQCLREFPTAVDHWNPSRVWLFTQMAYCVPSLLIVATYVDPTVVFGSIGVKSTAGASAPAAVSRNETSPSSRRRWSWLCSGWYASDSSWPVEDRITSMLPHRAGRSRNAHQIADPQHHPSSRGIRFATRPSRSYAGRFSLFLGEYIVIDQVELSRGFDDPGSADGRPFPCGTLSISLRLVMTQEVHRGRCTSSPRCACQSCTASENPIMSFVVP